MQASEAGPESVAMSEKETKDGGTDEGREGARVEEGEPAAAEEVHGSEGTPAVDQTVRY